MQPDPSSCSCSAGSEPVGDHAPAFQTLYRCHEHIREKLDVLEGLGQELTVDPVLTEAHLAALCDVLAFLDTAIPLHSADEEQTLFPLLRALPEFRGAAGGTPMDCMEREHVEHGRLRALLKRCIVQREAGDVARAALRIVSDYREHILKENEILFPMAERFLSDPELLARMEEQMRRRREEVGLSGC